MSLHRLALITAVLGLLALLMAACTTTGDAPDGPGSAPTRAAPAAAEATTTSERSIGYKVAVLEGGNPSGETDPEVIFLNGFLREIARRCAGDDAEGVADTAVVAQRLLREDYGVDVTLFDVLNGLDAATAGQTGMNCDEIAAAFVIVTATLN